MSWPQFRTTNPGRERTTQRAQRPAAAVVEDRVVPFLAQIVVARVIDDTVGPELPRELDVLRTADGSDVGAIRLGYLDGEASDAAGRTVIAIR